MKILVVMFMVIAVVLFFAQAQEPIELLEPIEPLEDWDEKENENENDYDLGSFEGHMHETDGSSSFNNILLPLMLASFVVVRLARR